MGAVVAHDLVALYAENLDADPDGAHPVRAPIRQVRGVARVDGKRITGVVEESVTVLLREGVQEGDRPLHDAVRPQEHGRRAGHCPPSSTLRIWVMSTNMWRRHSTGSSHEHVVVNSHARLVDFYRGSLPLMDLMG